MPSRRIGFRVLCYSKLPSFDINGLISGSPNKLRFGIMFTDAPIVGTRGSCIKRLVSRNHCTAEVDDGYLCGKEGFGFEGSRLWALGLGKDRVRPTSQLEVQHNHPKISLSGKSPDAFTRWRAMSLLRSLRPSVKAFSPFTVLTAAPSSRRKLHLAPPYLLDDYVPRYQSISSVDAAKKRSLAYAHLRECNLCPRLCGVNRYEKTGVCLIGAETVTVNTIAPHFGEG